MPGNLNAAIALSRASLKATPHDGDIYRRDLHSQRRSDQVRGRALRD